MLAGEESVMVELVKGGKYAWFVPTILGVIYVQNQWSRYLLNYMYAVPADDDKESIRAATNLNAADYGILTGYGFAGTFCVAGLVAGRLADIWVRKYIIFLGVLIWNAGMFGIGVSTTFWQLLVFRLVLGAGQAFTNPASYALIADYFPEDKRAEANGLFACGVYIGGGVASLCLQMAESWGWAARASSSPSSASASSSTSSSCASRRAAGARPPPPTRSTSPRPRRRPSATRCARSSATT